MAMKKNRDELARTVVERELRDPLDTFGMEEPVMAQASQEETAREPEQGQ